MEQAQLSLLPTHLRLTYIATYIHDSIQEVGSPGAFEERLIAPTPVRSVRVEPPFRHDAQPDTWFWSAMAETSLGDTITRSQAKKLRRAGAPLRHRGAISFSSTAPSRAVLEGHLHPYGVASLATFDIRWDPERSIEDAARDVDLLEQEEVRIRVGARGAVASLDSVAEEACKSLLLQVGTEAGNTWPASTYRVATILEGRMSNPIGFPPAESPIHVGLQKLAKGELPLAPLSEALVPQWSNSVFVWDRGRLIYLLDRGLSIVSSNDVYEPQDSLSMLGSRHRRMALLVSNLTGAITLIRAAPAADSEYFEEWARVSANRMARLYAPAPPNTGMESRAFIVTSGSRGDIEAIIGAELKEAWSRPDWPG